MDQEQAKVLAMYSQGAGISTICDELDVPLLIAEQYIEEHNSIDPEQKLMAVIELGKPVAPAEIKTKLVIAADWLVREATSNPDNEYILNKLGKISVILKNANDLVASNLDLGINKETKYGRFFKP